MNKQKVESLIDRLADKTLRIGSVFRAKDGAYCRIAHERVGFYDCWREIADCEDTNGGYKKVPKEDVDLPLPNPIRIGDVLAKMEQEMICGTRDMKQHMKDEIKLLGKWRYCGLNKSLQEIIKADTPESKALLEELNKLFPDE
jgi:hypothetical protein